VKRLLALLVLASCGHNTPPEAPVPRVVDAAPLRVEADAPIPIDAPLPLAQDPGALAAGLIALYEDLASAAASSTDCPTIATNIAALREKHAAFLDALRKADAAGHHDDLAHALEPYKDRVRQALDVITAKTAPCGKDPAVERAIDQLFGG